MVAKTELRFNGAMMDIYVRAKNEARYRAFSRSRLRLAI